MTTSEERIRYLEAVLRDLAKEIATGVAGKIHAIKAYRAAKPELRSRRVRIGSKDSPAVLPALPTAVSSDLKDRVTFLERRVNGTT